MKIIFLEIETENAWALASVGPASIAAYIRRYGHNAALLRVHPDQQIKDIIPRIEKERPDILGFSITTPQWRRAFFVAREIRKNMDIPIIAGGTHPTFLPLSVLESGSFDYVCLGEGEAAVFDMFSIMEKGADVRLAGLPNLWVRGSGRPELRPPEPIDQLPFMARDLLDETRGIVHINTMRGCPFPCTFCAGSAISRIYGNKGYVRRRPVDHVLAELRHLRQKDSIHYVIFLDDTFTVDRSWVEAFCKVYGREIGTGFSINARAETVDPELIAMLKEAGCAHIVYGVESGSRRIREEILKRPVDNKQYVNAFKWTKEAGIMATANYMIGIPTETHEDISQTLALNDELAPDDFSWFIFYPYPGTVLFDFCREKHLLPENYLDLPADNRQSVLNLPGLTKDDIKHYDRVFTVARKNNYLLRYGKNMDVN